MNNMKKWVFACVGVLSMASFAGCQSTQSASPVPPDQMHGKHARMMEHKKPHGEHSRHMQQKKPRLTEEQRAAWQKQREARQAQFEQIQAACQGKTAGQTVSIQMGNKTLEGKCELRFQPNKPVKPATANTAQS